MNSLKFSFFLVLMLLFQGFTHAQEWVSHLSHTQINDLIDTGDEFLMATDAGLVVMNKSTFEKTIFNKSNTNLSNNHIQSIAQAPTGETYIGTYDVVMGRFDGSDIVDEMVPESPEYDEHTELYDFEIAPNGDFWIGTNDGVFHRAGSTWNHYDEDELGSSFFEAWDIAINDAGEIFVGSFHIHKFSNGQWTNLTENVNLQGYLHANLFFAESGDLYFAGDLDSIGRYDGNEWTITSNGGFNGSEIKGFAEDSNGAVYFHSLQNGIYKLENNVWTPQEDAQTEAFDNRTSFFYIDEQNNKWLNHNIYLSVNNNGTIQSTSIASNTLEYNSIHEIHQGEDGNMYILMRTSTNSVAVVAPDGSWSLLPIPDGFILWPNIGDLQVLASNDIWLASYGGLFHFDGNDWTLKEAGVFSTLTINEQGKIYAINSDKVLIIENGAIVTEYNASNSSLSDFNISAIGVDSDNNLWIGSHDFSNGAAIQKVSADGNWTTYSFTEFPAIKEPSGEFHFENDGTVWIPSGNTGALKFDGSDWTNPILENVSSLEEYNVYGIESDLDGKLYFAHQYGFSTFANGEWGNLLNPHVPNQFSSISATLEIDNEGTLWWGSRNYGLFTFTPEPTTTSTFDKIDVTSNSFTVYPNPAHDYCVIGFETIENSSVVVSIYNNIGQLVSSKDLGQVGTGTFQETINLAAFTSGFYTVLLQVNDKVVSQKIIIQ